MIPARWKEALSGGGKGRAAAAIALSSLMLLVFASVARAEDGGPSNADLKVMADTLWVLLTAFLVFWMNAGFALVESGFCRAKNTVNILAKNFVVFAVSSLAFYAVGFGLMFADGSTFVGTSGFLLRGADNSPATGEAYRGIFGGISWTGVPLLAKFFFQLVFCGTAATIVSGAVAERIHFRAFIAFSFVLAGILYPITGHWAWGAGLLSKLGFYDFAGSTVVHSVGGWAALAGVILLGPRLGKYRPDGTTRPIPGHNMSLATLGGLILWLGWFGFNPGSTMAADPGAISHVALTTNLACAAGILTATLAARLLIGKPDLSMMINGALAGLVAITAPCAFVGLPASIVVGGIAGVLVVLGVLFFDRVKLDDPVGALSVHLVNGVWGTFALGLFASGRGGAGPGLLHGGGLDLVLAQSKGILAVGAFTFSASMLVWFAIKTVMGLRVSAETEFVGLDISEMGMEAYPGDAVAGMGLSQAKTASHPAGVMVPQPVVGTPGE